MSQFVSLATGGVVNNLNLARVAGVSIPLPSLETQRRIVSEIEAERRLVESNRELIERMERKIAATLARIWGEPRKPDVADWAGASGLFSCAVAAWLG